MAVAALGQLNLVQSPFWSSRSLDCFEKLDKIGEGTYGEVFRARDITTGEIVALKRLKMENEREGFPVTAIREIKIMKKLHHKNVINLKEVVTSRGPERDKQGRPGGISIYMVFEYMNHDLEGLIKRPGMRFTVPQIKCYMKQLLEGLYYCHRNGVLHRDIKCANLLIDDEGNLKIADFGLAQSFSNDHNANLTNKVITLWYRPPELLLGTTKYGPAVDMWSAGCIFAELLHGEAILPGKTEPEQLDKIYDLCGSPDEVIWPGVSKLPLYDNFKPSLPKKRRLREAFRHFDRHALELLGKMLTLDPSKRISAEEALKAEYFRADPLPCDPKSLPKFGSSHVFRIKRQQQEESAKRQKLQHPPQQHRHHPYIQHSGQSHPQFRPGPNQPMHQVQPPVAAGPSHHFEKRPSGGLNRYPQSGTYPSRGGQGGGYGSGWYPAQGSGPPYAGPGPRDGGRGYAAGDPNFFQSGPYRSSGGVRGATNTSGNNGNQPYGGWQK